MKIEVDLPEDIHSLLRAISRHTDQKVADLVVLILERATLQDTMKPEYDFSKARRGLAHQKDEALVGLHCKRCGQPVAYPVAVFCGAACSEQWEQGDRDPSTDP